VRSNLLGARVGSLCLIARWRNTPGLRAWVKQLLISSCGMQQMTYNDWGLD